MSNQKINLGELLNKNNPDKPKKTRAVRSDLKIVAPFSIGIEFELENLAGNFQKNVVKGDIWADTHDGSLRGDGREYVTRFPVKEDEIIAALENIYAAAKGTMEPLTSLRTSAHIHVNALDMDPESLSLFLAAGVMAEPYILTINDEYRKFCGYCNDSTSAVGHVISELFRRKTFNVNLSSRYYGINPMSVNKHGTVEFRHFSVPATIEEAVRNINICLSIKQVAVEVASALKGSMTRANIEAPLLEIEKQLKEVLGTTLIEGPKRLLTAIDIEAAKNERWSTVREGATNTTVPEELVANDQMLPQVGLARTTVTHNPEGITWRHVQAMRDTIEDRARHIRIDAAMEEAIHETQAEIRTTDELVDVQQTTNRLGQRVGTDFAINPFTAALRPNAVFTQENQETRNLGFSTRVGNVTFRARRDRAVIELIAELVSDTRTFSARRIVSIVASPANKRTAQNLLFEEVLQAAHMQRIAPTTAQMNTLEW